jgi:hypothetical protein
MIDKLTIASDNMDIESFKRAFGQTVTAKLPFNLYNSCHKVSSIDGRHLFTAYTGPRTSNMRLFRLEINPSKLQLRYTDLMAIIKAGMDADEATIQRIDHASDVEMPVLQAFETVRIKHKRNVRSHTDYEKGELTGFYIGSKFEQALIYNKSCDPKGSKFRPSKEKASFSHLTRFEIRHHSKKVPYRKLKELPKLLNFNPYQRFEVLEFKYAGEGFAEFQRQNKLHGLQNSFMRLNKQNNFRRDSSKHFDSSTLPTRLTSIYRDNLSHFFGECK